MLVAAIDWKESHGQCRSLAASSVFSFLHSQKVNLWLSEVPDFHMSSFAGMRKSQMHNNVWMLDSDLVVPFVSPLSGLSVESYILTIYKEISILHAFMSPYVGGEGGLTLFQSNWIWSKGLCGIVIDQQQAIQNSWQWAFRTHYCSFYQCIAFSPSDTGSCFVWGWDCGCYGNCVTGDTHATDLYWSSQWAGPATETCTGKHQMMKNSA